MLLVAASRGQWWTLPAATFQERSRERENLGGVNQGRQSQAPPNSAASPDSQLLDPDLSVDSFP